MIFETGFEPYLEDYDRNGNLTLQAMIKMLENAGNRHSDFAKDSVIKGSAAGKAWILTDWKVRVDLYPKYGQKLQVQTWIEKLNSPFGSTRDFAFLADGKICAKAVSKWVLLDTESKRLAKIEPGLVESYKPEEKSVFDSSRLEKISLPEEFDGSKEIPLRRSDIDFNNHVHNLCYLDFTFEALPKERYVSSLYKSLRISYKTALTEGDKAVCKYRIVNGGDTMAIFNARGELCCAILLGEA